MKAISTKRTIMAIFAILLAVAVNAQTGLKGI